MPPDLESFLQGPCNVSSGLNYANRCQLLILHKISRSDQQISKAECLVLTETGSVASMQELAVCPSKENSESFFLRDDMLTNNQQDIIRLQIEQYEERDE